MARPVVRYKQTVVGVLWAIFQPLLMAFVYTVIFGRFANFPSGGVYYPVFVFGGLLPMLYFTSSLAGGMNCLVGNSNLVTKVYFPRVLLPFAAVLTPLVDLLLGLVVLAVLMVVYSTYPPSWVTTLSRPRSSSWRS